MKFWSTTGRLEDGRWLTVISYGSPQVGDDTVVIVTLETFKEKKAAKAWGRKMLEDTDYLTTLMLSSGVH